MRELGKPYYFTVTATTRPRRQGERDGIDYYFVDESEFRPMIDRGDLLEWAEVYGNLYGVPKAQVVEALDNGWDVIIKADVQGAATIRRLAPQAVFIFLAPPDLSELERRLSARMTESPRALQLRLETARAEMQESAKFDHVVVNPNDQLDSAVDAIDQIVAAERVKTPPRTVSL